MNNNTFKVLSYLIKNPNKWYDTQTIAFNTNLTNRQVMSTISVMESRSVVRDRDNDNKIIIMFSGDETAALKAKKELVIEHYKITKDDRDMVYGLLSPAGYLTMVDLMEETGYTKNTLSRVLNVTDGVMSIGSGTTTLYRRMPNQE